MEKFDLYDVNRVKTGEFGERGGTIIPKNRYRLAVHVVIFNSEKQMLIQQRTENKRINPNKWDFSVGGSAIVGELSGESASRELFEELGISFDFSNTLPNFSINFDGGFDDFYILKLNINLNDCVLQKDEVKNIKWVGRDELIKMIDDKIFVNYKKEIVDFLFSVFDKPYGTWAIDE